MLVKQLVDDITDLNPHMDLTERIIRSSRTQAVTCRIDTPDEIDYFKNGGILPSDF